MVFVSGQIPALPSGEIVGGTIADRARQCIANVRAILEASGSSLDRVCKVGVFLVDMKDFPEVNAEYQKWFTTKPARTCVAVHQLPLGVDIEIECYAMTEETA